MEPFVACERRPGRGRRGDDERYLGVQCPWDVPEEAFMALCLDDARREHMKGLARYRDEFTTVT